MRLREIAGLMAGLALAGAALRGQQTSAPVANTGVVIRTETRQVLVDAVVTDKKGNYVRDLAAKDFKVSEDNKEQTIESFSYEADPASPTSKQQRYLVMMFDNSTMDFGEQAQARKAAAKFIDNNAGPTHLMAIVNFGGSLQITQNFTTDPERLKQAVTGLRSSSVSPNVGQSPGGLDRAAASFGVQTLLLGLRALARNLSDIQGRKILVLFSSGFPLTIEGQSELTAVIDVCNKSNVAIYPIDARGLVGGAPTGELLQKPAWRLSLASFGMGGFGNSFLPQRGGGSPGGGTPGGGTSPGGGRAPSTPTSGSPTRGGTTPAGGGTGGRGSTGQVVNPNQVNPNLQQQRAIVPKFPPSAATNQQVLYMLADGTGGRVIANTNDLLSGLEQIAKEQNEYYLIGYAPPDSPEGACHTLKVKVPHGYSVRARSGYCNVKQVDLLAGKPAEKDLETRAAANIPGTIAANLQAPFFYSANNAARVNVAMEIPYSAIKFEKAKGKLHAQINVLGMVLKPDGAIVARFSDSVDVDFHDQTEVDALAGKLYHYENQFDVASGQYTLKVVFSSGGEDFGKLERPLTIEPYDSKTLFLSGLALSKQFHKVSSVDTDLDSALLEGRAPLVAQGMEITPAGSNKFTKDDIAVCYLEIYEPLFAKAQSTAVEVTPPPGDNAANPAGAAAPAKPAEPATRVALQYRVIDRKTGQAKGDTGMMEVTQYARAGNPVLPIAVNLQIDKLGPGAYRAEFKATDATRAVTRSVDFEVN